MNNNSCQSGMKQNLLFVCLYRINKVDDVYSMITYTDLSNLFISFNALQKLQGKGPFLFLPLLPNHRNVETSQWLLATCTTSSGKRRYRVAGMGRRGRHLVAGPADPVGQCRPYTFAIVSRNWVRGFRVQFIVGTNGLPPTAADHSLKISFEKTKHLKIRFKQIKYTK